MKALRRILSNQCDAIAAIRSGSVLSFDAHVSQILQTRAAAALREPALKPVSAQPMNFGSSLDDTLPRMETASFSNWSLIVDQRKDSRVRVTTLNGEPATAKYAVIGG